jgi:mycoredoxin
MKKFAPILIFILALVLLQNSTRLRQFIDPINTQLLSKNDVILYSTSWCPYCVKTRHFFRTANISFTEHDIEKSPDHNRKYESYGRRGVPLIIIGQSVIQGYDPKAIRGAIEALVESRQQHVGTANGN